MSHSARTRHTHQVSSLCLSKLQQEAYHEHHKSNEGEVLPAWKVDMCANSPTFNYWNLILYAGTVVHIFVHSQCEGNFILYIDILEELTPWFFAMDQQNYACWLPVHIRDIINIPDNRRELQEFRVFSKTKKRFWLYQNNAKVKRLWRGNSIN